MENQIYNILNDMAEFLNVMQMKKLQKVLIYHLNEAKQVQEEISNEKYLEMFLTAKQIEGCSDRTIQYYRVTIEHMLKRITIPLRQIATEDIRQYLIDYQQINNRQYSSQFIQFFFLAGGRGSYFKKSGETYSQNQDENSGKRSDFR